MKRLINTKLFSLFEKMNSSFKPGEEYMKLVYDDFVCAVAKLCTCAEAEVPIFFTLHYTRLELEAQFVSLSTEGAGKK